MAKVEVPVLVLMLILLSLWPHASASNVKVDWIGSDADYVSKTVNAECTFQRKPLP